MLAFLLLSACGGGLDITPSDIEEIRVEPESLELVSRPGISAEAEFSAVAKLYTGEEVQMDLISWESSNLSAGSVDEFGVFTSVDTNGGITDVIAKHFGVEGSASVKVIYTDDLPEEGVDPEAVDAFRSGSPASDDGLALEYPFDGVTVPRNLDGLGFRWSDGAQTNDTIYRIRFRSEITDISIYTSERDWVSSTDLWELISAANRRGDVDVYVEAGDWNGSSLSERRSGPSISLVVNRLDARGSVLYWAANTAAIMRIPLGSTESELFWESPGPNGGCVGCHSLADEAERLVVTHDGANGRFSVVDISDEENPELTVSPNDFNRVTFKTVSPDGVYILGIRGNKMILYALETGVPIKEWEFDTNVSHPDWSPDGSQVVFVRVRGQALSDMAFAAGEIVQMDIDVSGYEESGSEPVLSNEQILKPNSIDGEWNYYYPAYSPDGEWIAYNMASNSAQNFCYAAADAELWLMSRDGGETDIRLDRANGQGALQNSYPRWGPLPDDDVLWLAYSSRRTYSLDPSNDPQIWLVGIDPSLAEQGEDPSSAPFWLPGQSTRSDNHLPVWWSK
jgi:hypothetical protein